MKKAKGLIVITSLFLLSFCVIAKAADQPRMQNPIVRHMFTADPSAHVWADGRLYVYPSTDVAPPRGCDRMDGYHVFSTDDMLNWTDHGEILHSRDVEWGRPEGGFMWAPDCAYKNGTYYYYFPHPSDTAWNNSWKIGIATSKNPATGFKVQGYIKGISSLIDPCVFIDDDGQAYFYHGGGAKCMGGRLKDNMTEIDGEMQKMEGLGDFHEGAWVFKRKGVYYMVYPDNFPPNNRMQYAMSDSPLGPWQAKGIIVEPTDSDTMHGSVVEYKGQWYIFYHSATLSGGIGNLRSICFDKLFFNADGTIQKVKQTRDKIYTEPLPAGCNQVRNSSFEQGIGLFINSWGTSSENFSRSTDTAIDGKYSLRYKGTGCNPSKQNIRIIPNTDYDVSVWIKVVPGSKGAVIFDTEDKFDDTCQFIIEPNEAGKWIHKTGSFNSENHTRLGLRCFTSGDFDGTCYWDNITVISKTAK